MKATRLAGLSLVTLISLGLIACDDNGDDADNEDTASDEEEIEEAEDADEEAEAAAAEISEDDVEEADEGDASGDAGTRDNPLSLGETIVAEEWELTVNDVTFDADDAVAEANEFNDEAEEGNAYILVNVTATYTGEESEMPSLGTEIAWVTGSGETIQAFDSLAVAPDEFDGLNELYNGGTEEGNIALAVPEDYDGLVRVRLGMFDREEAFVSAE